MAKDRPEKVADVAPGTLDAKATLSEYLQLDESPEGWAASVSDPENDREEPPRAPNLSILKQIKDFLSGEDDATAESSEDGLRSFKVDYPYYDGEAPETRPVEPTIARDFPRRKEREERVVLRFDREISLTANGIETVAPAREVADPPSLAREERAPKIEEKREEIEKPESEIDVEVEERESEEIGATTDVEEVEDATFAPLRLEESVSKETRSEKSSVEETPREEINVTTATAAETTAAASKAPGEKRSAVAFVPFGSPARRKGSKMTIFRRFVDLVDADARQDAPEDDKTARPTPSAPSGVTVALATPTDAPLPLPDAFSSSTYICAYENCDR